jgi:hypothetical protein
MDIFYLGGGLRRGAGPGADPGPALTLGWGGRYQESKEGRETLVDQFVMK